MLTAPQKVLLAERAETQSINIYEFRHDLGIWLYLKELGQYL